MIDFTKIKDIISVLPLLIIYILPGYIFISVKNFIMNKKQVDNKNILLKSIVISYVIINYEMLVTRIDISSPITIILTICFTVFISYLYSMFIQSECSNTILKKLKINTSLKEEMLTDIVDFELGMWIRVYLSSDKLIYVGKLKKFEKISDANYNIALSNFILYKYSGEERVNNKDNNTEWVFINVKDNYRIELVYLPKSKKNIN